MGYKCPECERQTAVKERGAFHCQNDACGVVWWGPFDKPSAGQKRRGYTCHHCKSSTSHPIANVEGATIWRCSTCSTTVVGVAAD